MPIGTFPLISTWQLPIPLPSRPIGHLFLCLSSKTPVHECGSFERIPFCTYMDDSRSQEVIDWACEEAHLTCMFPSFGARLMPVTAGLTYQLPSVFIAYA